MKEKREGRPEKIKEWKQHSCTSRNFRSSKRHFSIKAVISVCRDLGANFTKICSQVCFSFTLVCREITRPMPSCTMQARNRCASNPITGFTHCFQNSFTNLDIKKAIDGSPNVFLGSKPKKISQTIYIKHSSFWLLWYGQSLNNLPITVHESSETRTAPPAAFVSQEEVWLCMPMQLPNPFHSFSVTTILHPTNAKNVSQTHNDDEHPHLLPRSLLHVPTICILPHTGNHFKFHCTKRWTNNDYYWTILNPSSISPWGKFYFLSFGVDMVNTVIRNRREIVFQCLNSKVSFYRCISDASLS